MNVKWFNIIPQNQIIKAEFLKKVEQILDSGEICMGKLCQEFEEKWAAKNGAKYCVLLGSGTAGLTLTIDALDIKGLILTPAISFVATANAIVLNRQSPLFCEVDSNGNIDIKHAISRTYNQRLFNPVKALLPVALYGNPPDLENLQRLAKSINIPLVLDSSQSHLAMCNGKHLIDYCDAVIHSFYVTKGLSGITESGCVLTNNEELYEKLKQLRNHGRGKDNYDFEEIGYNSRPSEIVAASLLVKLPFISEWTERRIEIANKYNELLKLLKEAGKLRTLDVVENNKCTFHLFPIWLKNRDEVRKKLLELGVETNVQYPTPLHKQKSYIDLQQGPFEIAEKLCDEVITLPMHDQLKNEEVDKVCESLNSILNGMDAN